MVHCIIFSFDITHHSSDVTHVCAFGRFSYLLFTREVLTYILITLVKTLIREFIFIVEDFTHY